MKNRTLKCLSKEGSVLIRNMRLVTVSQNLTKGGDKLSNKRFKDWRECVRKAIKRMKYATRIARIWYVSWRDKKWILDSKY